jgi:hypothetical protein
VEKSSKIQNCMEVMSKDIFGTSVSSSASKGLCVDCRQSALERCYSEAGKREYGISGLCEICFDKIFE